MRFVSLYLCTFFHQACWCTDWLIHDRFKERWPSWCTSCCIIIIIALHSFNVRGSKSSLLSSVVFCCSLLCKVCAAWEGCVSKQTNHHLVFIWLIVEISVWSPQETQSFASHLARWIPGETMLPHQTLRLLNPLWIWLPHQQESQWGLAPKRAGHSLRCHYAWLNNWRLSLYQASAGWTQGDEGDTSGFLEGQGLDYSPFWRNL